MFTCLLLLLLNVGQLFVMAIGYTVLIMSHVRVSFFANVGNFLEEKNSGIQDKS